MTQKTFFVSPIEMKIRLFACAMHKLNLTGAVSTETLIEPLFSYYLQPLLVIDNSCYLAERFFAGIFKLRFSQRRCLIVRSDIRVAKSNTLHVDRKHVEATRKQQC